VKVIPLRAGTAKASSDPQTLACPPDVEADTILSFLAGRFGEVVETACDGRRATLSFWDERALVQNSRTDADLLQAIGRISTYSSEARYVWRGQPDLAWGLNAGLVRRLRQQSRANGPVTESQLRGHEMQLLESARAAGYGRSIGVVELLAILQHHGAATRLLDVSSDPMVAMWFAIEDQHLLDKDGALFAINISNAETISGTESRPWPKILDSMQLGEVGFYEPPGADERIKVQRGRFIFSGLSGREPLELSLPIDVKDWSHDRRVSFFDEARGSGRPIPPSILVLKVRKQNKFRLLRLLENSYGYTSETMYPDLSGFAGANGWQRPLRRDRLPTVDLTDEYLPVAIDLGESPVTSVRGWSSTELLRAARRELSISARRVDLWLREPTAAPQYWAVYHADEVIGVFEINKASRHRTSPGRYLCDLSKTDSEDALKVLGCSFLYEGKPIRISGRGVFVRHTRPRV
jgi:FRG domain